MVENEELVRQLMATGVVKEARVTGDGYHYQAIVVSDVFSDKSLVVRQQWVYAQLKKYIQSGELHALTMKTWTESEWETQHG